MTSVIFALVFLSSSLALFIGLLKPSIVRQETRKSVLRLYGFLLFLSFLGIGLTAPRVDMENKAVVQSQQEQANSDIGSEKQNEANVEESDNGATDASNSEQAGEVKAEATDNSVVYYSITSVVDGDTVKIDIDGKITTFRLIGMNTPEVVDPRTPVQCFGQEASNKAKELLSNQKVRIEKDPASGEVDKYGRSLAYIYREDGLFFNKHMIEQGYAYEYTYDIPYKYQAEFKEAQKSAQDNKRGLWSTDTCSGNTTPAVVTPTVTTPKATAPVSSVSPSVPVPATTAVPANASSQTQSTGKYYTSSFHTSKYYYTEACDGWKSLSKNYLRSYDTLEALLAVYPTKTLSPQCNKY